MMVSVFKSAFSKESFNTSPEGVMQIIVTDSLKEYIEYLRSLPKQEYDTEKLKTTAVTWSGTFKPGDRSIKTLESYSKLVVIDVDKLDATAVGVLKGQLADDEYVRYCFISPSGYGLKFIVEVNTEAEHHRSAFLHLKKHFEEKYLIKVDDSGKDLSRLCFLSYDPFAIINLGSKVFEVDTKYGEIMPFHDNSSAQGVKAVQEVDKIYDVCVKWVERTKTYHEGNRNNYIHALACALNRCGVSREDVITLFANHFNDLEERERLTTVRSAYFHNQHEHGSVQVKDIGVSEFVAPPYIANYTDDVAANDLMRITASLYHHKMPNNEIMDIVSKVSKYYDSQGYIDMRRASLFDLMNRAVAILHENVKNATTQDSLDYKVAEDIVSDLLNYGMNENAISTGIPSLDVDMFGGLEIGNVYGLIGLGESFKSVMAQRIAFVNSMKGIPSLYLNGEMSKSQWYERLTAMTTGLSLKELLKSGNLKKENVEDFIENIKAVTGNNMFIFNGSGFDKKQVLATIENIYVTTGKKIKLLISDGITQWSWGKDNEINATINNSILAKDVAKEANGGDGVAHLALFHVSGDISRHKRNTGDNVRGGKKVLANLDAYFCTSRILDPQTNALVNSEDLQYRPGMFYLRYVDKRSATGIINNVIDVKERLELEINPVKAENWEIKLERR